MPQTRLSLAEWQDVSRRWKFIATVGPLLSPVKEFKTHEYLIKNTGRVISRDELLNKVWGYESYPCTRTVDNHILQLRKKLGTEPARPKHLHTVHGAGYKFLP